MSLKNNFEDLKKELPSHVTLAAVSKTHTAEKILELYELGQRIFAENKVQEILEKKDRLPSDIQWHMIGHLQSNKVKQIAPFVHTIQSVDSEKILQLISREAEKNERTIEVLLQVKIAEEDTKYGLEISETKELYLQYLQGAFPRVKVKGLMGMATLTEDENQIAREFQFLKRLFDQLSLSVPLEVLSMGMTSDYPIAIKEGANLVRIGSALFGNRN